MSILHVRGLTHGFGDRILFRNIEFRLLKGEHVGLVGANGSGKSTLLNLLTNELIPDEGDIEWHTGVEIGFLEQHPDFNQEESIKEYLRGAFSNLFSLEEEMLQITERLGNENVEMETMERDLERLGIIQETLETHHFYSLDAKIEEVAAGLGIASLGMSTQTSHLSGGQRTKLMLAKLLLSKPDVLLLDEPTNYLDDVHIAWLQKYLTDYPHAFILISHDTSFMNEVVTVIHHLEHKNLTRYVGNYVRFTESYELRKKQNYQAYLRQQKEIEKLEDYIARNKARASTAKQAKSREKKLEKINRIEKPGNMPVPRFSFKVCREPNLEVLVADGLSIGYKHPLFKGVDLTIKKNAKIALTGHNGIGKTTTIKSLLGKIEPLSGQVKLGSFVRPMYFEQEMVMQGKDTALQFVWSKFPDMQEKDVRKQLARCGLKNEHIYQQMSTLSGGEQTKVRICVLMLKESNFLVLDEPTNHLDIRAKQALKEALQNYKGTILLVSHEPEFYEDWVTETWNVENWIS
ncbi:ABC-F family ATP-binding cassette domain-containing protein [Pseudalkalibacillus berkeleyi]|uniref:ATP-binding cassette domain-containing protein n=1 Tax=Pseudalkalibacillus berkeleyi TaxID=1069813 RepID=A0ABS9GY42_9BACL|nr:ABC-F family ATP-binding cassette domain-containing protein [Pseudalkalibacillus berkeleyi]MCF6136300.1 ATP-binding cassette domain-containing protein [Pseudalkalibacillus berkeleyi]